MEENTGSERAGRIISFLQRNKFLTAKEKGFLLKNIPSKTLVKRLLSLAFAGEIFRCDLDDFVEEKTFQLKNADKRLVLFIRMNEEFFSGKIKASVVQKALKKLFRKIHIREYAFYKDLVSGGTCYLDYNTYRKALAKKDKIEAVRFMAPRDANTEYAWGGKQYIVQPNYQGTQMKLILEDGKMPRLIGRDQLHYEDRFKKTLRLVNYWFEDSGLSKARFDCILAPKDMKDRPRYDWKGKDHVLWIYDYEAKGTPLKKRLKKVADLCNFMKGEKNKKVKMIPSEMVTGTMIPKMARHYSMAHYPYVFRNGIIVKNWDSGYSYGRSADWLCLVNFNDQYSGSSKGRATLVGFSPNKAYVYGMTNNGLEIEIGIPNESLIDSLAPYLGYTVEYSIKGDYYSLSRILYDNGREL